MPKLLPHPVDRLFSLSHTRGGAKRYNVYSYLLFAIIALSCFFFTQRATTQTDGPRKTKQMRPQFVQGELLVRFKSETAANNESKRPSPLRIEGREIRLSVEKIVEENAVPGLRLARVDAKDTLYAIAALKARADVLYAEPNFIRYRMAVPNDPEYPNLWGLKNTGSIFGNGGLTPGADIDAELAWNITTGSRTVVVGVVDSGIEVNHPDLRDNIWTNPAEIPGNGVDDDLNGRVDDINGYDFFHDRGDVFDAGAPGDERHGTHVAGTIGATGNNSIGIVGVNWQVSLMSLKVFGREEENQNATVAALVRAYVYAKKMRDLWASSGGTRGANIRVLNASLGGYGHSQAEADAISALNDANILFVASAGNFQRNNDTFPPYPASYDFPNVISVAASGLNDNLPSFTNVGARTVTLSAPGVTIESTVPFGNYTTFQGTSQAAPHVSGAAALICAAYPTISIKHLKGSLIFNGDFVASHFHKTLTARRLNAFNSLIAAGENDNTPPAAAQDFRVVTQNGRTVTLGWRAPGDDGNTGTASLYDIRYSTNDLSSAAAFDLATPISPLGIPLPTAAGALESAIVEIPFGHTSGFIGIRVTDNLGNNSSIAMIAVTAGQAEAQLYDITQSAPQPLSTGGTEVVGLGGQRDDVYAIDVPLPFAFPFFGRWMRNITVSTNGAVYFSTPPKFLLPPMTGNSASLDAFSSTRALHTNMMIAGLWDDLITRVIAVTPDPDRIIYRWEGTTFDIPFDDGTTRGVFPVNFEMELKRNGTIIFRYGEGNQRLLPVVGISGGSPDSYGVSSHTSEIALMNLTNANTVTFTPRLAPTPTTADLQTTLMGQGVSVGSGGGASPLAAAVVPGQVLQYSIFVTALGPDAADNVVLTGQLAPGTSFVGCVGLPCSGPAPGTNGGVVTVNMGTLGQLFDNRIAAATIQVMVNAQPGTTIAATFNTSSSTTDPNLANNVTTATTLVADLSPFGNVLMADGERLFSMALKHDGTVWFWGIPFDQAESSVNAVTTPKRVEGLSKIVSIAAGSSHALALRSDGTVWSWGINRFGQLGNQPWGGFFSFPPTQIPGLQNIQSIAASGSLSLALGNDGTVWAWGDNDSGIMNGVAGSPPVPSPVHLTSISGVRSISAGVCTYAIKQDGSAWSWSDVSNARCGTGSTGFPPQAWLPIPNISNVKEIKSRFNHGLGVLNDGTVWTWGSHDTLGTGSATDSGVPVRVPSLNNITGVAAASDSCLALRADGTVWFWGDFVKTELTPVQVTGLSGVKAIGAWTAFTAIMSDDTLQTWGFGSYGQMGDGTVVGHNTPGYVKWLMAVATPVFNPESTSFVFPQSVTVQTETDGAAIHYTTNGAEPTENDPIVNSGGSIVVNQSSVFKAKAWKSGWTASKVAAVQYEVAANDLTSLLQLMLKESTVPSQEVAAIDNQLFLSGPFRIINENNHLNRGPDRNTRITIFVRNISVPQGAASINFTVNLMTGTGVNYEVGAEDVRAVTNTNLLQVTFRLPDSLTPGPYFVFVKSQGQTSRLGTIIIASP